ncbi:PLP-dependent aminotransferase family protein [Leptolyngbya sp. FACHB-261]|uniref:MocR-like pyridoxine biosynthesis transcription factor PdxR n=1 Tax=Leptolyngbya sp. FACHB-261 TaxID=2692806 RepID=UPI0016821F2D|nr:PLP-dependent aminotransferase family protein [Leptolyngbya sp. FACHB-261]MBD2103972.1 PLP-dependent aminotransferase family protein [Leptolyngbya sp. FACHB-261]
MDFAISLDPQQPLPLHRQLYAELRQAILTGRLTPGQRLPSTRSFAQLLGISRATVTLSYEQLLSEGYLQAVVGSGTFVCQQLTDELLRPAPIATPLQAVQAGEPHLTLSDYAISLSRIALFEPPLLDAQISFRGQPDLDALPLQQWRQLLSRHCQAHEQAMLDYCPDLLGYRPLREAIARYLARSRAVQCDPDQVLIVNGSQQALDLLTRILINRGDRVALEDPGYPGARRVFLAQGADLCPIPVDETGLQVEQLSQLGGGVKLVYVTPSHQFPTGVVLSLPRRLELLDWAQHTGAMVIEDDYDSEYRYGSRPIPALQGLDQGNSVLYIGTFSKVLFPALRIGYLVVPRCLVKLLARARWLADRQTPLLEQYALTDFINEGHLERHIHRMRRLYDQRRQVLVQALQSHLPGQATILGENAGMHVVVRLQTSLSDLEVVARAAQVGVGLVSTRNYYLQPRCATETEFLLGYAALQASDLQEGVHRLAQVLQAAASRES